MWAPKEFLGKRAHRLKPQRLDQDGMAHSTHHTSICASQSPKLAQAGKRTVLQVMLSFCPYFFFLD